MLGGSTKKSGWRITGIFRKPVISAVILTVYFFGAGGISEEALAFVDPFTVVAGGAAAVNTVGTIVGEGREIGEAVETAAEIHELYAEFDEDSRYQPEDGAKSVLETIEETENLMRAAGYTEAQIKAFNRGSRSGENAFLHAARAARNTIRAAKRMYKTGAKIFGKIAPVQQAANSAKTVAVEQEILSELKRQDAERKFDVMESRKSYHDAVDGVIAAADEVMKSEQAEASNQSARINLEEWSRENGRMAALTQVSILIGLFVGGLVLIFGSMRIGASFVTGSMAAVSLLLMLSSIESVIRGIFG